MDDPTRRFRQVHRAEQPSLRDRVTKAIRPLLDSRRQVATTAGVRDPAGARAAVIDTPDEEGLRTLPGGRVADTRLALSVDGCDVRVVQTARRRILGWGTVRLPDEAIADGTIGDAQMLAPALEHVFASRQLPRAHVRVALPFRGSALAVLSVPWLEDEELQQAISDEATRVLGYSEPDSFLWWQPVPGRRRDRRVFVLTCPRDPVNVLLDALEQVHVRPDDLDLGLLAASRAINQRDAIVAIVEGARVDTMAVIDDLPIYARSVVAVPATSAAAEDLVLAEISSCISMAEEQKSATREVAPPVYLCGAAARSVALADRVQVRIGRRPSHFNPPLFVPSDMPAAEYAAAIGMAIKEQ
jgi:hypothetical protein